MKEINQTERAKRKLKSIAKSSNLDIEFVSLLAKYSWNYDPNPLSPKQSIGSVKIEQIDTDQFKKDRKIIFEYLGIKNNFIFDRDFLIRQILSSHKLKDEEKLRKRLISAGLNKNYCFLSEYSTYHYVDNLTYEKLNLLTFDRIYSTLDLIDYTFLKVVAGGGVNRYILFYVYCDLCLQLPYNKTKIVESKDWIEELLHRIDNLPENSKLSDLIKCCKNLFKGDKYFKQEILQSLSYSGDIKVGNIDVKDIFIPEFRDVLTNHFYSNEWTYPLRFWNK